MLFEGVRGFSRGSITHFHLWERESNPYTSFIQDKLILLLSDLVLDQVSIIPHSMPMLYQIKIVGKKVFRSSEAKLISI